MWVTGLQNKVWVVRHMAVFTLRRLRTSCFTFPEVECLRSPSLEVKDSSLVHFDRARKLTSDVSWGRHWQPSRRVHQQGIRGSRENGFSNFCSGPPYVAAAAGRCCPHLGWVFLLQIIKEKRRNPQSYPESTSTQPRQQLIGVPRDLF